MQTAAVRQHFEVIAPNYDQWKKKAWYYHGQLKQLCSRFIPPHKRVLELGCGSGDILAALKPRVGVGIDISQKMVRQARKKYPGLKFYRQDLYRLRLKQKFDYVVLVDVLDHLPDIYVALRQIKKVCTPQAQVILTTINPVWEPVLDVAEKLRLKMPEGPHNWVPHADLRNLLELAGFKITTSGFSLLAPKYIPRISDYLNQKMVRWGFWQNLGAVQYFVCQKQPRRKVRKLACSVIIPAFNEAENISQCIRRVPNIGKVTEIIVVDDGSIDTTAQVVQKICSRDKRVSLIRLPKNLGKVWAVKAGFDAATGEVLIILDADMAVPPQELIWFYDLIATGQADFVNGTRMVYPMEHQAMRQLNLWGNKMFGTAFSWLLGQRVTDTLCGTKALLKNDYAKIKLGGEPWGDFDLLFGAARLKLNLKEFPVHYKKRVAGESKMKLLRHGFRLMLMCFRGLYELKIKPLWS